jgi:hypothetical protein
MNTIMRRLNKSLADILDELECNMRTNGNLDIKAYLELNELIVKIDKITILMLSDIDENRVLN